MPLIVATLVYGVVGLVVYGLVFVLLGGASASTTDIQGGYGASFTAGLGPAGTLVLSIVLFVLGIFVQAAFLSGVLDIADGRPVSVGSFFKPRNFGNVVLAGALLSVISAVLDAVSLLPSFVFAFLSFVAVLVFTFFALFTIAFATDRGAAADRCAEGQLRHRPGECRQHAAVFCGPGAVAAGRRFRLRRRPSRGGPAGAADPGLYLPPARRWPARADDPLGSLTAG